MLLQYLVRVLKEKQMKVKESTKLFNKGHWSYLQIEIVVKSDGSSEPKESINSS